MSMEAPFLVEEAVHVWPFDRVPELSVGLHVESD
jgi:hypothetical protein